MSQRIPDQLLRFAILSSPTVRLAQNPLTIGPIDIFTRYSHLEGMVACGEVVHNLAGCALRPRYATPPDTHSLLQDRAT